MSWFCCQTNPKSEATANHWLRRAGYETLYLHFAGQISHAGRKTEKILPLLPRYLFVAVPKPPSGLYGICTTIGVHSILTFGDGPEEVPIEVIDELRGRGNADGFCVLTPEEKQLRKRLQRGAKVRYSPDPFTEWFGRVMLDAGPAMSAWINGRKVTAPSHHFSPIVAER